jgi:hypothetical protein
MENHSHRTAITRNRLSAPMKYLVDNHYIHAINQPSSLDFGCGKGQDADMLGMTKYDPYFFPKTPLIKYALVTCNYVLNVVLPGEQRKILSSIEKLLWPAESVAYISVRRDVKKDGFTNRGTYQRNVILTQKDVAKLRLRLETIHENSNFCIYRLTPKN